MGTGYLFKESDAAQSLMEKMIKHKFRPGSMLLVSEEEFQVAENDVMEIDLPDPKEEKD